MQKRELISRGVNASVDRAVVAHGESVAVDMSCRQSVLVSTLSSCRSDAPRRPQLVAAPERFGAVSNKKGAPRVNHGRRDSHKQQQQDPHCHRTDRARRFSRLLGQSGVRSANPQWRPADSSLRLRCHSWPRRSTARTLAPACKPFVCRGWQRGSLSATLRASRAARRANAPSNGCFAPAQRV